MTASDHPSRLLYIEDSPENVKLIESLFGASRFEVIAVPYGRAGIEVARRERPDVILLDMFLPDMTGLEVIAVLKEDAATRELPIVVISGSSDLSLRDRALEQGAAAYLTKPYAIAELAATVERFAHAPRSGS
jgi:CheY-like chemotaxis protein